MSTSYEYLIALGSNLEPRSAFLSAACQAMVRRCGMILKQSAWLETDPIGGAADQPFLNGAVLLASSLAPEMLLKELQAIEHDLGRTREIHWGNRTIDLDIILCRKGDVPITVNSPELTIPHPEWTKRDFVRMPAIEIAAEWVKSATALSRRCLRCSVGSGPHLPL